MDNLLFVFIQGIRSDIQSSTPPPPPSDLNRDGEFENLRLGRSGGGIWGVGVEERGGGGGGIEKSEARTELGNDW